MAKEMLRQGGRSARIQSAVHEAVRDLLQTVERDQLTVPMIADRAGVTPSTIYRRWGDIVDLLADVALAHMRPIADPADTGAMATDLERFFVEYAEEMSSPVGREMLSDVLGSSSATADNGAAAKCCHYTVHHLETLLARARARGEAGFDVETAVDKVVAPIVYHILFRHKDVTPDYCRALVDEFLKEPAPH